MQGFSPADTLESIFDTNTAFSQYVNLMPLPLFLKQQERVDNIWLLNPAPSFHPELFACHEIMGASAFTRVSETPDTFFL